MVFRKMRVPSPCKMCDPHLQNACTTIAKICTFVFRVSC